MKQSKKEYAAYVDQMTPNSPLWKNLLWAFCVGGGICVIAQGFSDLYQALGLTEEHAKTAVPVTMVFLGALFTALGLYDRLARHAGAGTIVPITGFANAIVSPAMEFRSEGMILGVGAKLFIVAGPVIAYGTLASVIYGLILCLLGLRA